jgi:Zn ribbon nucleic-acid-binding protein
MEPILATLADLAEEHDLLTVYERDGVDIVRCEACGHAVVVGA